MHLLPFTNSLLDSHYPRRSPTKRLLKDAVIRSGMLPTSIVGRRKKGFGIPVARWMRMELHDYFRAALLDDLPSSLAMLDRRTIANMWKQHCRREVNHYKELWALFMLIQWARTASEMPSRQQFRLDSAHPLRPQHAGTSEAVVQAAATAHPDSAATKKAA